MSSFHVDDRITLKIEFDLAVRLGEFIVQSGSSDKQIMAFGHRLMSLEKKQEEPQKWIPKPERRLASAQRSEEDRFAEGLC